MAYAATVAVTRETISGRRIYRVTIAEVEARDTSEATITGVPVLGTIVSYRATLTAGTGTTITPVVGRAAAFAASTQNYIADPGSAGAHIDDSTHVPYYSATGTLYVRSTANNAATDHAISTEILIAEGVV